MNAVIRAPNARQSFQHRMIASVSLRNRRIWLAATIAAIIGGLAFNWSWLVAAGAAPLLIGVLPCSAMCALHLCAKPGGQSCKKEDVPALSGEPQAQPYGNSAHP